MGLPKTTDDDIRRVFDGDVADYLKTQMLVDTSPHEEEQPRKEAFEVKASQKPDQLQTFQQEIADEDYAAGNDYFE